MTRPERYVDAAKVPVYCPAGPMQQGHSFLIAELDTTGIYLWCKRCHKAHWLSLKQLQGAITQMTGKQDASTSVEVVL